MSQGSTTVLDGSGAVVIAEVNTALATLLSNSSGPSAPTSPISYQFWADTTAGLLKQRNAANTAWVTLGSLADLGIQSSNQTSAVAAGTANALTAAFAPALTAYISGAPFSVRPSAANTTTTPTISFNGLAAKTIVKGAGLPLAAGDIAGAGHWIELQYDATLDKMILRNPATGVAASGKQIQSIATPTLSAGAMTIPSVAFNLDFRSSTLGAGGTSTVSGSPSALTIPSGATLGTINGIQSTIVDIVLNNSGTLERAVVNLSGGNDLSETGLISTTAISASATADNVVYSNSARTNVPYRVVGIYVSTQAAAGTWASALTLVQGAGGQAVTAMGASGFGQTLQNVTGSRAIASTYYNATSKERIVIATITSNAVYNYMLTLDGVTCQMASGAVGYPTTATFPVSPGASYSVNVSSGAASVTSWIERG